PIKTTSPRRSVIDQRFVNRVVSSVRLFKVLSSGLPPYCILIRIRNAPREQDLNLLSRRHLRCDLRRNGNLAVWRELTPEAGGFHLNSSPTCLYHLMRQQRRIARLRKAAAPNPRAVPEFRLFPEWRRRARVCCFATRVLS